jgi:uncharacterized protein
MLKRLLPQELGFYDLFERAGDHTVAAAKLLLRVTENYAEADPLSRELEALEHACDQVTHETLDRLAKTFITPLDPEDIHQMILSIDDVVDLTKEAANRLTFFKIGKPTVYSINMAKQIVRGCEKLSAAVHGMRTPKQYDAVSRDCIAIHEVENAADEIHHEALAELFATEKDAIVVIKWKDIYETMESVTDRCEDVANVLQNVIVKMT